VAAGGAPEHGLKTLLRPLLRMAAIDFLNPAPLMWNFEHGPEQERLGERYAIEKMTPAACAEALRDGSADLGLIPVGAYAVNPGLAVIPGCAIASPGAIRSLLLVVRGEDAAVLRDDEEPDLEGPTAAELARIKTVALDTASRTSALYTQILFRRFWRHAPVFAAHPPELDAMLGACDAALLIGDPALRALRDRGARLRRTGERLRYLDLGYQWQQATGTAWVSAFWAVRQAALRGLSSEEKQQIVMDLQGSRDAGLAHVPELVAEWAPRLELSPGTVETYLTRNIHYLLDAPAIAGVERFFAEGQALGLLPETAALEWMR
jgi:chorismate dehydratase